MEQNVIIIGGSHGAAQLCISLRQGGWTGGITIIGDDTSLPYHRPPLSKTYLSGEKNLEDILIRPASVYENANIEFKLGVRVLSIDRDAKKILTNQGETLTYSKLVLATGARVRQLPVEGEDLENVLYLRDFKDVLAIKQHISIGKKAVVIGGGYIGLETSASLKKLGVEVVVLEAMSRILQRVTAPELSKFYKRIHSEEGVKICENITASKIIKTNVGLEVHTSCSQIFPADFVVVGIGVLPNMELAKDAGLKTENGIVVDEFCQTSGEDIYAIGDVTQHYNSIYDTNIRLESVPNATEQAKTVALHLNGKSKPYNSLPWFWSDQFDLKLQIAGLSAGYDNIVVRGNIENSRSFAVFYFKGDKLLAVDAVNAPSEFMMCRQVLAKGKTLNKALLVNSRSDLKDSIIE